MLRRLINYCIIIIIIIIIIRNYLQLLGYWVTRSPGVAEIANCTVYNTLISVTPLIISITILYFGAPDGRFKGLTSKGKGGEGGQRTTQPVWHPYTKSFPQPCFRCKMYSTATVHSVTDRLTDRRQYYANSRSYCMAVQLAKNMRYYTMSQKTPHFVTRNFCMPAPICIKSGK